MARSYYFRDSSNGKVYETICPEYHRADTPVSFKAGKAAMAEQAKDTLRAMLPPGSTVYTILRHVSRSGMQRRIDLYAMSPEGPVYLSGLAACAMGENVSDKGGIVVGGCGMDMGFSLVYNLSAVLYPHGFDCIGKANRCPSNDHSNGEDNAHHKSGGYALRHAWM